MHFKLLLVVSLGVAWSCFATTTTGQLNRCDPTKVVTVEACAKCHGQAVMGWRQTPHFQTFEKLHRNPRAKEIVKKLGLKGSIKRNDVCIGCHYTVQKQGDRLRAVSGISCESCHGAARDWVNGHSDYGGPTATKAAETEAHRANRIAKAIENGMNNPKNLYSIARGCLTCHTVPNEKLVNIGGHQAGSDFELVAWSQGTIRHNFLRTDGKSNARSSQERLRVMFVVGLMADLELSTRATAKATSKSTYGVTSAQRAAKVATKLYEIQQKIKNSHLQNALEAFAQAELRVGNAKQLNQIANEIMKWGNQFATQTNGAKLGAIDGLLPTPDKYR